MPPGIVASQRLATTNGRCVVHWQMEVTFDDVRAHLGVETQRQRAECVSARATPAQLDAFSLVSLLARAHDKPQDATPADRLVL
jgi:hypothetical protein